MTLEKATSKKIGIKWRKPHFQLIWGHLEGGQIGPWVIMNGREIPGLSVDITVCPWAIPGLSLGIRYAHVCHVRECTLNCYLGFYMKCLF